MLSKIHDFTNTGHLKRFEVTEIISLLVSYYLSCQDSLLFATNIVVSLFVQFCLSSHSSNCYSSELFYLVLTVYIPLLAS